MNAKTLYGDPPKKKTPEATQPTETAEFTPKHEKVKKKMAATVDNAKANAIAFVSNKGAGTTTDTSTGETKPDAFKRTEKRGATHTEFIGDDKKTVTFRGLNDSREVDEYRKQNVRDETDVNKRRARNANDANLFTDVKKNLTEKDKETLRGIKHISN